MNPLTLLSLLLMHHLSFGQHVPSAIITKEILVRHISDFEVNGAGNAPAWNKTDWVSLQKLDTGGPVNATRFKILYSNTGIYVLFQGDDQKITTQYDTDFTDLFLGDVFEVFFHPDPTTTLYFEYEVNALDRELVLLIPQVKGMVQGWQPWHYEGKRKVVKKVQVNGGQAVMGGTISSWSAELFFPYSLLQPLIQSPPRKGAVWNANFYRLDYDTGTMIKWAWQPVQQSFHEIKKFGRIRFE